MRSFLWIFIGFVLAPLSHAEDKASVDPANGERPLSVMMGDWLMGRVDEAIKNSNDQFEKLTSNELISSHQQALRKRFIESIGGFPERTPLNAVTTGVVHRDGYRVEKVLFESQPRHYVTGLCFVPDHPRFTKPYPAALVVCGHSANGKGYEGYQTVGALLALNGVVGLVMDPICQGERIQHFKDDETILVPSSTDGHTFIGLSAMLLGQNTARFEVWDGMRGIDYLSERDDVDPEKIGCMGNSGGGTQTSYLMSLDDRIKAASPACYITSFERLLHTIGPQDAEQIIFGQLNWGMEHSDYLIMRAPSPVLLCAATEDFFPIDGAWASFRKAKRVFTRLGYPERVGIVEADGPHGWHPSLRQASVQWMVRWLAGRDEVVREPVIKQLTEGEFQVTPRGQVHWLADSRSVVDLNLAEYQRLRLQRQELWKNREQALLKVREISGIRNLAELSEPQATLQGNDSSGVHSFQRWILEHDQGISLPASLYVPKSESKGLCLFVHEAGKNERVDINAETMSATTLVEQGFTVLSIDLRGVGESMPGDAVWYNPTFGNDGRHVAIAYLLGKNYVAMRAEDILVAARWFIKQQGKVVGKDGVKLVSVGRLGPAAMHAGVLEPNLFSDLDVVGSLNSWESMIESPTSENQFVNCIHGALQAYDLSDLIETLGDRIRIRQSINAMGTVVNAANADSASSNQTSEQNVAHRLAIERGLELVKSAAARWRTNTDCFSCHHQTIPLLAMAEAVHVGVPMDTEWLKTQVEFTHDFFNDRIELLNRGGKLPGGAATAGFGMWALAIADCPGDDVTAAATEYLLKVQGVKRLDERDPAKEPTVDDGRWLATCMRPPMQASMIGDTVLALLGAERFATPEQRERVRKAKGDAELYLAQAPLHTQQDYLWRLWGLHSLGGSSELMREVAGKIFAAQNEDGGWGETSDSPSDAYTTGQTLYMLAVTAASTEGAKLWEARDWLLHAQKENGAWHVKSHTHKVQPYFDNGDPYGEDQFLSTAATAWAVAGLCRLWESPSQPAL